MEERTGRGRVEVMREVRIPRAFDILLFNRAGNHYKHLVLRKNFILVAVGIFKNPSKAFGCFTTGLILSKTSMVSNVSLVYVGVMICRARKNKRRQI